MTTTRQISHAIEQGNDAVAVTFGRIYDLVDFIIRINVVENSEREGSSEATKAFRKELNRYLYAERL